MNKYIIAFVLLCTPVHAAPWEEVIPTVSEQAARYLAEAELRFEIHWNDSDIATEVPYQGSFEATVGSDSAYSYVKQDHECGILGRMLGVPELIRDQERIDVPDITDDMAAEDIGRLWGAGRSYELWVEQATRLVALGLTAKVSFWNKRCNHVRYAPEFIISSGPSYSDYPTLSYLPDDHPVITPDTEGWTEWEMQRFLPDIQAMLEQGPNFAGRYSIAVLSCGTSCRGYNILDAETGDEITAPFGGESTPELNVDFNNDSQLIYARHMGRTSNECVLRAWHFDGNNFSLRHEQTSSRGEIGCNTGNFRVIAE